MSSPIALPKKDFIKSTLIWVHQIISHNHRTKILCEKFASYIDNYFHSSKEIRCLDVGCGDMSIAENINNRNPRTFWKCIDIYDLPNNLKDSVKWRNYQKFDGLHIPFSEKSMDVVLLCDVLHHSGSNALILLKEAARVGEIIIVKDHFEYSFYSRTMLYLMDIIGNWGYGVKLPNRYFTIKSFQKLYYLAGLDAKKIDIGIDLYSRLPLIKYLLRPKWHFIAILESESDIS
jgi:SAM-dependent methyltransferase